MPRKGSVSRILSLSDPSTQPFKENRKQETDFRQWELLDN
jgi:hypothetical protein